MKTRILAVVLGTVAVVCPLGEVHSVPPASDETEVAVAGYPNTPANQKVGDRIVAIFKAHHIQTNGWPASASVSVNVPGSQAKEARRLLARAILDEGLPVILYEPSPQANRVITVSPEAVLGVQSKR